MSKETKKTLLHGQVQEGLRDEIMRSPGVSGAQMYKELCLASRIVRQDRLTRSPAMEAANPRPTPKNRLYREPPSLNPVQWSVICVER